MEVIPTQAFYSAKPSASITISKEPIRRSPVHHPTKMKRRSAPSSINRGVRHKIRRPRSYASRTASTNDFILENIRNEKLRNLIETKREEKQQIEKVYTIMRNSQNPIDLARPLRALNMHDDDSNNNLCDMKPSPKSPCYAEAAEFSDMDSFTDDDMITNKTDTELPAFDMDDDMMVVPIAQKEAAEKATSRPNTPNENRKFFKTGRTTNTRKEVTITENIKALVFNGRISLVSEKKSKPKRHDSTGCFLNAQAQVKDIIKNLDDSVDKCSPPQEKENLLCLEEKSDLLLSDLSCDQLLNDIEIMDNNDYCEFRKRIPFNTNDPVQIEQQHLLLDFLISHNICNEEMFNCFIADSENSKEKAANIVDKVVASVKEDNFRQRIPYNTTDPIILEQQTKFLGFLLNHNACSEENFDIFIANYDTKQAEAEKVVASISGLSIKDILHSKDTSGKRDTSSTEILDGKNDYVIQAEVAHAIESSCNEATAPSANTTEMASNQQKLYSIFYTGQCQPLMKSYTRRQRIWAGGYGSNQYQIDAGQKEFGAKQCKQCGLVYTVHEPEEEKLHREFHSSLHVLRFKGWIDEDRVADFPEWGRDGRIIRISDTSHIKRRERLNDILKIIDKELGFSSYIIPKSFVAYLAVRKCQIVGLCLVQPLKKANKYICNGGVDSCTIEEFDAKCGISRIWVSPLHRRMHIAVNLIQAVQINTIMGEEIPFDKIAFSAPTELGRLFAQKVTGNENFLVYQ